MQIANIGCMDDIQNLFKETTAELMEGGLEAELDDGSHQDLSYFAFSTADSFIMIGELRAKFPLDKSCIEGE